MKNILMLVIAVAAFLFLSRKKSATVDGVKTLDEAPAIELGNVKVAAFYSARSDTWQG